MVVPFARLAVRGNIKRIKRYHVGGYLQAKVHFIYHLILSIFSC